MMSVSRTYLQETFLHSRASIKRRSFISQMCEERQGDARTSARSAERICEEDNRFRAVQ